MLHLEGVMSFGFLALGCLFLIAGVAYLAYLMGIPESLVVIPVVVLLGAGALSGVVFGTPGSRRSRI
jgi:hypothetical protein